MSVQIQCKSAFNLKTERLIERLENNRGWKEWACLVFPHPTISNNQLAKHSVKLVNLNFSLTYLNHHESSDTVKGLCKRNDN